MPASAWASDATISASYGETARFSTWSTKSISAVTVMNC